MALAMGAGPPGGDGGRRNGWWGIGNRGPSDPTSILIETLSLMAVENQGVFAGDRVGRRLFGLNFYEFAGL